MKDLVRRLREQQEGAVAGYVIGWLLGVPVSVLFLIFILRGCR